MRNDRHPARVWVWVWVLALAAGCARPSSEVPREPVWGTVTLDAQPVASGSITFLPAGGPGPSVGATIRDGAYSLGRGEGPGQGPHRVEVTAMQLTGRQKADPDDPGRMIDEARNIIPPRYNSRSSLTAEVKAGGVNKFDFDLSAGGPG